ncbi:MAG: hypothetical protein EON54_13960, partial [Alcaligenaceae bacterium]
RIAGTTDTVTVYNFFNNNDTSNFYNPIQQVRFDDGTVWTHQQIQLQLSSSQLPKGALAATTTSEPTISNSGYFVMHSLADSHEVSLNLEWIDIKPFRTGEYLRNEMNINHSNVSIESQAHLITDAMAQFSPSSSIETGGQTALHEARIILLAVH